MRIAIYTPAYPGTNVANGIAAVNAMLVDSLRARGHQITVITPHGDPNDPDVLVVSHETSLSGLGRLARRFWFAEMVNSDAAAAIAEQVRKAIRVAGTEIFLIEETQGWAGIVADRVPIPVVTTLHGPWCLVGSFGGRESAINRGRADREGRALQKTAGVTAPSAAALNQTLSYYELRGANCRVIHNPFPVGAVDLEIEASSRRKFLFVGRFDLLKGGDTALLGFARLVAQGADAYLTFVGLDIGIVCESSAGDLMKFADFLRTLPVECRDRITFLGQRPKTEIEALRKTHFATIVTSRFEVFPTTVLESMAAGRATIATKVGGIAEMLTHEESGLLIAPDDPDACAAACTHLLHNPDVAAALGRRAYEDLSIRFAPALIAEQWENYLTQLIVDP